MSIEFLPGITTSGNNWRAQIEAAIKLGVAEVALFPTTLGPDERSELYDVLDQVRGDVAVVAVHLRDDMERWEYDVFQLLGTEVFNLHATPRALEFIESQPEIAKTIFVENGYCLDEIYFQMANLCGGVCIDVGHLESFGFRQENDNYEQLIKLLPKLRVGMTHVGAVCDEIHETPTADGTGVEWAYEEHFVSKFPEELEYLRRPEILAVIRRCRYNCVELNDSIGRQLAFIRHIEQNIIGQR